MASKDTSNSASEIVAVCIPCFNEELTVADVVRSFKAALPNSEIYVFDNCSTDKTAAFAKHAGATVIPSPNPGKGNVVRHIFSSVQADRYVLVDGDSTYSAEMAPALLCFARNKCLDMAIGRRCTPAEELAHAYRPMHQLGNLLVCRLIQYSFRTSLQDVFSGYRIFSREFAKSIPLRSPGFQIEVEMTLQALSKGFKIAELDTPYTSRPAGSFSKLNTYRDGLLVLSTFASICRDYRPQLFFAFLGSCLALASLAAGLAPIYDYWCFRWVYHLPLAVLAVGLAVLSALTFCIGIILETQLKYHNELFFLMRKRLGTPT